MQPESAEQSQNGNGIVAGDDAEPASVSYPVDQQETLDLCIDVTVRRSDASLSCHAVFTPAVPTVVMTVVRSQIEGNTALVHAQTSSEMRGCV